MPSSVSSHTSFRPRPRLPHRRCRRQPGHRPPREAQMARTRIWHTVVVMLLLGATSAFAQKKEATPPAPPPVPVKPPPKPIPEPKLVFDREVFSYPGSARRDPFKPLLGKESLGPLFDDLKLKGIIYTSDPTRSIVLIQDGSK